MMIPRSPPTLLLPPPPPPSGSQSRKPRPCKPPRGGGCGVVFAAASSPSSSDADASSPPPPRSNTAAACALQSLAWCKPRNRGETTPLMPRSRLASTTGARLAHQQAPRTTATRANLRCILPSPSLAERSGEPRPGGALHATPSPSLSGVPTGGVPVQGPRGRRRPPRSTSVVLAGWLFKRRAANKTAPQVLFGCEFWGLTRGFGGFQYLAGSPTNSMMDVSVSLSPGGPPATDRPADRHTPTE